MIETVMFFGLGFLVASLLALMIFPLVHARATRLAARRLMANIPLSIADIDADKDLLRAHYAVSSRRFEMRIEELTAKMAEQLVELGRKSDEVNRLRTQLAQSSGTTVALEASNPARCGELHNTEHELVLQTVQDEHSLRPSLTEPAELNPDVDHSRFVASGDAARNREVRKLAKVFALDIPSPRRLREGGE